MGGKASPAQEGIVIPRFSLDRVLSLARPADARHAVRVMAAVLVAYTLYATFDLAQGYWAVFTTLIVMQASIGGTLDASVDRLIGTIAGALVGGFAAWARPQTPTGLGVALVGSAGVTVFLASMRPSLKVAPVTAAIMLLSPSGKLGPLQAALYRVIEIGIGAGIAVAATRFIFPARSQDVVIVRIRDTIEKLVQLLQTYVARLVEDGPGADMLSVHVGIRAALAGVESAMGDAERERWSRLGEHRISPAMPRTLWRVRNDAVAAGRALSVPWPAALAHRLAPSARDMLTADVAFLQCCDEALTQDRTVQQRDEFQRAHLAFQSAVESFRGEHLTQDLTFDAMGAVFGFAFALESLFRNLGDLADRIDESVRGAGPESSRPKSPASGGASAPLAGDARVTVERGSFLTRKAREGDREAVEGAATPRPSPAHPCMARRPLAGASRGYWRSEWVWARAPSTTLRAVPLPGLAGEEP